MEKVRKTVLLSNKFSSGLICNQKHYVAEAATWYMLGFMFEQPIFRRGREKLSYVWPPAKKP